MRTRRKTRIALVAVATLAATGTIAYAATFEPDAINLQSQWTNGGSAKLELEDRNTEPAVCFVWDNPAPQDGEASPAGSSPAPVPRSSTSGRPTSGSTVRERGARSPATTGTATSSPIPATTWSSSR